MNRIRISSIRRLRKTLFLLTLIIPFVLKAQMADSTLTYRQWDAEWITVPQTSPSAYGVYFFRKDFNISQVPSRFPIFVSGDNRYKLYVNEQLVSLGPARGDIEHWNYETIDIAPQLKAGRNVIAAQIWNEGDQKAEAQFSFRTGFILQGAVEASAILNTNKSWNCIQDHSYSIPSLTERVRGYSVVPPNEQIDMRSHIKGWQKLSYDDSSWTKAQPISRGTPKNTIGIDANKTWRLVSSAIPQMELKYQRFGKVRKVENANVPASFPAQKGKISIPPYTTANILLDNIVLTNAFPTIDVKGGKESIVTLTYGEALYDDKFAKGNRNETEGKRLVGKPDILISDGSNDQTFTSLSYRTFRYVNIQVQTKEEPLIIDDFYSTFVGYPFILNAKLETENEEMQKIFEMGWRTARLCAVETYMDCPYYEQLQYIGDSRIQALVSLYDSGDDRLVKSMLTNADNSRQPEGITLSRYPSVNPQIIPTFSLWYIGMLHDYMMYGSDITFLKNRLPGERQILGYFQKFQDTDGSIKRLPNWAFIDWAFGFNRGMGHVGKDGCSAMLDLQLLIAYQNAYDLEKTWGMNDYASLYQEKIAQLAKTIKSKYWDDKKKLFSDTSEKDKFSQHTNSLAILSGLVNGKEAMEIGQLILADKELTPASIYFKYYVHQALIKAGLGDDYLKWLDDWRRNIELGLTTLAETSNVERARSDCHAWGASPNIEFFRTLLGIDSAAPMFGKVKIEPHLGNIKKIGGEMPHPSGKISVKYDNSGPKLKAEIILPDNTTGVFIWKGTKRDIKPGINTIQL